MKPVWILIAYIVFAAVLWLPMSAMSATYKDDIGFTRLQNEVGTTLPDGDGLVATIVEAATYLDHDGDPDTGAIAVWLPDPGDSQLTADTIIDESGSLSYFSSHATTSARLMLGSNSMAAGMDTAECFLADHWWQSGCLRMHNDRIPLASASRIAHRYSQLCRQADRPIHVMEYSYFTADGLACGSR